MSRRSLLHTLTVGGTAGLAGCLDSLPRRDPPATPYPEEVPRSDGAGYTHTRRSGNRVADWRGDITEAAAFDVNVPGTPVWVAGTAIDFGQREVRSQWAVALEDGSVRGYYVTDDGVESAEIGPDRLDGPPVVSSVAPRLLTHPESSPYTSPIPCRKQLVTVGDDGVVVFQEITAEYDLVHPDHWLDKPRRVFDVNALPDARIVSSRRTVCLFGDATDEYGHGALGDSLEGGSIVAIDTDDWMVSRFSPPEGTVFEGTAPIVTWLDRDPAQLVATASDAQDGARVVAIDTDTGAIRSGPPVGTGNRWRHTLAVDSFGPNGEEEIAAVRTPHIGGVAEFYRPTDNALELVATDNGGYQSHVLGSRNLDGGLSGTFSDGNQALLLVPTRDRTELAFLRRVSSGVERYETLPIGGKLTTNIAGANEDATIAAGSEGRVRFWVGQR
ncbi:hypothetical protein C439_05615 [Haloferax mediterranei ATCC 33500]|uniref:Uncharacterized protein n=1 Tax=Haloferax mediterranei (strain ATCC 33500 / DSM 1411 / JCM 8866 / NBRC 14739 / NCIMB 2177 / R-4) TaxID=523841 RepID=M0J3C4_HALMT|nr:hypothetical protein BM92_04360 [Haloferax mediterranei ATCC 33500]EMA03451.1 hypothetical protein C439_05615 [Haloferax mediterranei ATCC 33500]